MTQRGVHISYLEGTIEKLKIKLDEFKKDAPSLDNVLKDLGADINKFIQQVNIKNHHGVGIDEKTFFPKVRNIEYRKINSGGLRTIVSIGYLASILLQKLRKDTNIPGLLMIDTVGKFLGKPLKIPMAVKLTAKLMLMVWLIQRNTEIYSMH